MVRVFPTKSGVVFHGGHKRAAAFMEAVDLVWVLARELSSDYPASRFPGAPRVLYANIRDFSAPEGAAADALFREQLGDVTAVLQRGGRVLTFCYGGRGRTAIALAAIAMRIEGIDAEAALALAKDACSGPEEEAQRAYVRSLRS